jgi:hypothetical protein
MVLDKYLCATRHTSEGIRDENENRLDSVHPLEFLEQSKIK